MEKHPDHKEGIFEVLDTLSRCGLGAFLLDGKNKVLAVNEAGRKLLGLGEGQALPAHLAGLLDDSSSPPFCRIAYGKYVLRQPAGPFPGLHEGQRLIVFRDASADYRCALLEDVVSRLHEGVVISDENERLYYCNTAASRMDSIVAENELGERIEDIYRMADGSECPLPQAIRNRRPLLNYRQRYATRHGKTVDAVANTWPVLRRGHVLGAFNLLEDWSTVNALHRQIIDLQEKLAGPGPADGGQAGEGRQNAALPSDAPARKAQEAPRRAAKSPLTARYHFSDIIYADKQMCKVIKQCRRVARSDSSVMIYGETGTGKELFAQSIHNASPRADGPFLAINCAALPENLLESLLFGSVRGAYTGAENRPGLFEQANGGTLLLDEINSMNVSLQAKLLRVLQEGTVRRVGGNAETRVDVRVLSCTNVPPQQAIAEGKMRQDLFYRLGVVVINIPPLRERKGDIPLLVGHFIADCNATMQRAVRGADDYAMDIFRAYSWPGNVRELQHAVEHAMNILPEYEEIITPEYIPQNLLADAQVDVPSPAGPAAEADAGRRIPAPTEAKRPLAADYPPRTGGADTNPLTKAGGDSSAVLQPSLGGRLQEIEKNALVAVLSENRGNISKSARILHMSRQNLQYRIKRYGIDVGSFR